MRAAEAYTNLLEYTHTAEAYEKRGTVYMEKGDTDRGLKDFEKLWHWMTAMRSAG